MTPIEILPIPCLSDNYAYRLRCPQTGAVAVVDPSEAAPMLAALDGRLDAILNTHHHYDHTGGNEGLLAVFPAARVYGHASDRGRIPGQTDFLEDGDRVWVGQQEAEILFIPGHTLGAIAYAFTADVFTGDTLFVAGCGRLFEGDPPMMHLSLQRLGALPGATRVWVGHEYTEANLRFALAAEPDNPDLPGAIAEAATAIAQRACTMPSTIAQEHRINPFLRAQSAEELGERRAWKDRF